MASQPAAAGQGMHRDLRRTVDRVGERFDERSVPLRVGAPDGLTGVAGLFDGAHSFVPIGT
jgi:hypothetical protein